MALSADYRIRLRNSIPDPRQSHGMTGKGAVYGRPHAKNSGAIIEYRGFSEAETRDILA